MHTYYHTMASYTTPIHGVWTDQSARRKPVEDLAQWATLIRDCALIIKEVKQSTHESNLRSSTRILW